MRDNLNIVKVGGAVVEDSERLNTFLDAFTAIGGRRLLVHGGGRLATSVAKRLGIETTMIEGRRVTDEDMLRVVTMVYGGLVNKLIVALLQRRGLNALGLSGADMNIILSHKREPLDGVDYGLVGDIDRVDGRVLTSLINKNIVPVIAPLTHDGQGQMLNTNADTIAAETAKALAPFFNVSLYFCFEKNGVLNNNGDEETVIPLITPDDYQRLKNNCVVSGGMIPKITEAFDALNAGVKQVIITGSSIGKGTIIKNS